MANSLSVQVVQDGPRNVVLKVEGILDTSDLASTLLISPATLAGMDNTGTIKAANLIVERIAYAIEDTLEVRLWWDATTQTPLVALDGRGEFKAEKFGGIPNNSGAGRTGNINITTLGWAATKILGFTLLITLTKQGT
jgi:hypothetical protein